MSQTTEPKNITAGDTVAWSKSLTAYPADEYALHYVLQPVAGGAPISIDATADGTTHDVEISAATSAGYSPGEYRWVSFVTDLPVGEEEPTQRYTVASGTLTIAPDPLSFATTPLRSHARKTLEAIEAVLEGRATQTQAEYNVTYGGQARMVKYIPIAELLQLRSYYAQEARREDQSAAINAGLGGGNRILTRFV